MSKKDDKAPEAAAPAPAAKADEKPAKAPAAKAASTIKTNVKCGGKLYKKGDEVKADDGNFKHLSENGFLD